MTPRDDPKDSKDPKDKKRRDEPGRKHPLRDEGDPHRKEYRESDRRAIDPRRKDDINPRPEG